PRPVSGRSRALRGDPGVVVKPKVPVIDLEGHGREGRAVDPAALGSIKAFIGIPASGLMARGSLKSDDPVTNPRIPSRPGLAAVLVECQRRVIPVVDVGRPAIGLVTEQEASGLGARGPRPADAQKLAAYPRLGGHRRCDRIPGLVGGQSPRFTSR